VKKESSSMKRHKGAGVLQPKASALDLFGSLRSRKKFPGRAAERSAVSHSIGKRATIPQ